MASDFFQIIKPLIEEFVRTNRGVDFIDGFDSSCFNGKYVTGDIDQAYLDRLQAERNDASKQEKLAEDEQGIDMHNHQE